MTELLVLGAVMTHTNGHREAAGMSVVFLLWFTMVTDWAYVMCSCSSFVSNRRPSRPAVGQASSWHTKVCLGVGVPFSL